MTRIDSAELRLIEAITYGHTEKLFIAVISKRFAE